MIQSKLKLKTVPFLFILCTILLGSTNMYGQVISIISQNNCSTFETSEVHIVDENSGALFSSSYPAGNFTFILSSPDASYTQSNSIGVFTGIPDGVNYFVIVHDNVNNSQYQCPSTFEIYTDNSPLIEVYLLTQPICPDDSVVYQVNLICGGTGNVTYYFSNSVISLSNTSGIFTGVNGGTFYAEDENGTMSNTVVMDSPFLYEPLGLDMPVVTQNCDSTAMISAQATGGDGNYTYYIINVATGLSEQSTTGVFYVNEGSFYVGVSDGSGCNHQCPQLTIVEPCCNISVSGNITDVFCPSNSNNSILGSIELTIFGGTAPYVVTDNLGNSVSSENDASNVIVFNNLDAGNYSYSITDATGCSYQTTDPYYVNQPADYAVQVIGSTYDCNTGLVDVIVEFSGYNPDGGGYFTWGFGSVDAITTLYGLTPGEVITTVICPDISLEQCPGDISFVVPDAGNTFEVEIDYVFCPSNSTYDTNNGNTTFTFSGGQAPYYISYANNTYTNSDYTVSIDGLTEGTHTVAAYDATGCTQNIDVIIEQPEDYAAEVIDYTYDCATGLVDVTVEFSGYNPDGGGYYFWGYGSIDAIHTFEGLTPGEVITSTICPSPFLEACPASLSFTAPDSLNSFDVEIDYVICPANSNYFTNEGTATFTFNGGTEPYIISDGINTYTGFGNTVGVDGLAMGTHTFTATDASGCSQIVTAFLELPEDYGVEVIDYSYNCSTGLVDVTVEFSGYNPDGGGYFTWAYGSVDAIHTIEGLMPGETVSTIICPDISLEACPGDISFIVPTASGGFVVEYEYDFCPSNSENDASNGNTTFTFDGGLEPYSITDGNTVYTGIENEVSIDNLAEGVYSFIASDGSGCSQAIEVVIVQPEDYTYEILDYTYDCSTGLIDLTVAFSGHNPDGGGYFLWGYGSIDAIYTFEDVIPGDVISSTICPDISLESCPATIVIDIPYEVFDSFEVVATTNDPCPENPYSGSASFEFFGGNGSSYTIIGPDGTVYNNSFFNNTTIYVDSLSAGTYNFIAFDDTGCEQIITIVINDSQPYAATIIDYYFDCTTGLADVIVEFSGYNPDGGGYYLLGYGDVDVIHTFQGVAPGEIIGGMICPAINLEQCPGNISVTVPMDSQGIFGLDADYTCDIDSIAGNIGGQITLYMIGGQAPYVIIGSDGSSYTTMDDNYVTDVLADGTYSYTVYDINGCTAYYDITINCSDYMTPAGLGGSTAMVLFPNPILVEVQFLRISYDIVELNQGNETYHFAITELATGREIEVKNIQNTKGTILLDIQNYPVGSFVCTLYPEHRNRVVDSQQFIIQRK